MSHQQRRKPYCYAACPARNSPDLNMPQFIEVLTGDLGVCNEAYIRADKINVGLCNTFVVEPNTNVTIDDWCVSANPFVLYTEVREPASGFDGAYFQASASKIHEVSATVHLADEVPGGLRRLTIDRILSGEVGVDPIFVYETQPNPDPVLATPLHIDARVPLNAGDRISISVYQNSSNTANILPYPYSWWYVTETPYFRTS